jgi:hypothetical protein
MALFRVIKKFDGNGESLVGGDIVETSNWKYTKNLVSLRYMEPAPEAEGEYRVPREPVVEAVIEEEKPVETKPRRTREQARDVISV